MMPYNMAQYKTWIWEQNFYWENTGKDKYNCKSRNLSQMNSLYVVIFFIDYLKRTRIYWNILDIESNNIC